MLKLHSGSIHTRPDAACLLVHGGAWDIPQDESEAHLNGLRQAIARGRTMLLEGAAALEVVTETVSVLESNRNLSTTMGHSTGLIREQCPVW